MYVGVVSYKSETVNASIVRRKEKIDRIEFLY